MAFRPCVTCGSRFGGRAEYSYLTWFVAEERHRVRVSQCGSCSADLRNGLLETGDIWRDDDWESAPVGLSPVGVASGNVSGVSLKRKASA